MCSRAMRECGRAVEGSAETRHASPGLRERARGRFIFGPLINYGAKQPVYRLPFSIRFDKILHYLWADFLQDVTKISYDRKIPSNSLFLLDDVRHTDRERLS